jgi:beta-glucanase (GH16 family)
MFVPDNKTLSTFTETSQSYDLINFDFFKTAPVVNPDTLPTVAGHTVGGLMWSDEFAGNINTSFNSTSWTGRNCGQTAANGGGTCHNNEQQYYAPSAAKKDGSGNLVITTTRLGSGAQIPSDAGSCLSDSRTCPFVSARLDTQGKVSFQYGYIEARISNPTGGGNWPAFWMLGDNITSVDWPSSGELDIMEGIGSTPTHTTGAIHYNFDASGCCGGHRYDAAGSDDSSGFSGSYHRYGIAWLPDSVDLYVDGYRFLHATPATISSQYWPFNNPFFLILNNAIGPNGGFGGTYDGWLTSTMKIDWVRAYQLDSQGTVTTR